MIAYYTTKGGSFMTRKEMLITSLLLEYGHRSRHTGANIRQIMRYSDIFAEIKNDSQLSLSEISFRRALPNLLDSGYVGEGDRDGLKKTYYLTDAGHIELVKLSAFKDTHKSKIEEVEKQLALVRARRNANTN